MKTLLCCVGSFVLVIAAIQSLPASSQPGRGAAPPSASTAPAASDLPPPLLKGAMTLEEAITQRRSVRQFLDKPLDLDQLSQLCWAAQGITEAGRSLRTVPSAGALYPLELYVVTADGVHHYLPKKHRLERHLAGDLRGELRKAAHDQESVGQAAAVMVITAVVERTARKYGARAERYCFIEAGHVGQNLLLQAAALHLGGVAIGAFDDGKAAKLLRLPKNHDVLYLVPIGHPR